MKLSRGWSWFLVAFGVWSWIIWPTFIKNIANDKRSFTGNTPHAFFIVHLLLTIVSLALGTVIGFLGIKGLRRYRKVEDQKPTAAIR
ncbi:MAG: hypothetical protein JWN96_2903 [Mycobacterium sp.]|jgi:hypothetical protein|nr:hypothetical protein [Mycobacterium sp.]